MNNMSRTKFITGIGLSSILTACGGGASGGSSNVPPVNLTPSPTPMPTPPPGLSVAQIQSKMQSIASKQEAIGFSAALVSLVSSASLATFIQEASQNQGLSTYQKDLLAIVKAGNQSSDILSARLGGKALTPSQQSTLDGIRSSLAGNSVVQQMSSTNQQVFSTANTTQFTANMATAFSYPNSGSHQATGDEAFDTANQKLKAMSGSIDFGNLAYYFGEVVKTDGFGKWVDAQPVQFRAAMQLASSAPNEISTLSLRKQSAAGVAVVNWTLGGALTAFVAGAIVLAFIPIEAVAVLTVLVFAIAIALAVACFTALLSYYDGLPRPTPTPYSGPTCPPYYTWPGAPSPDTSQPLVTAIDPSGKAWCINPNVDYGSYYRILGK
jgi:hypothetical protein